jgi:hypothetical protein
MTEALKWYDVSGNYAGALVAATTNEEALRTAEPAVGSGRLVLATEETDLPAPPTAPGIYYRYAE